MRSVDIYSHRLALESGITVPQLSCLTRILESGPMPLKALARAVDLSASTTVGIVDRLEKKGLVTRVRSIRDRREVEIAATEEGRIVAAGSPSLLHDRLAGALDTLPERERAAIAMSLERIVELMEIRQVDAARILDTGVSLQAEVSTPQLECLEGEGSVQATMPTPQPAHE